MYKSWFICPRREFLLESWLKSLLPTYHPRTYHPHHPRAFQINPQIWSLDIRLHNFGSNWVQITHFQQEIFSGKIDCYYCVPAVFCLTTAFQKKFSNTKSLKRLHNFVPNLAWVDFSIKNEFTWKLTNISLVFYIPLCCIISSESRS